MAKAYRTESTPDYTYYEPPSILDIGASVDTKLRIHTSGYTKIEVVSDGLLEHGYNQVYDPDGSKRWFFIDKERYYRTAKGIKRITTLITDPLRNMNLDEIRGITLKRGKYSERGYYPLDLSKAEPTSHGYQPSFAFKVISTRTLNSQSNGTLDDSDLYAEETSYNVQSNDVSAAYRDLLRHIKNVYTSGTLVAAYLKVKSSGITVGYLNNLHTRLTDIYKSSDVALDIPISITLFSTTLDFTLRDARVGNSFDVADVYGTGDFGKGTPDVVGVRLGSKILNWGTYPISLMTSSYYDYERSVHQARDSSTSPADAVAGFTNTLTSVLPDTIYKIPAEYKEWLGKVWGYNSLVNMAIKPDVDRDLKMPGIKWSFDPDSTLEYFCMFPKIPNDLLVDSIYLNGVDAVGEAGADPDIRQLLTQSQGGNIVAAAMTKSITGLTEDEESRVRIAVERGIRVV